MIQSPQLPWLQAREKCLQSGGDLATFKTKEEKEFINANFPMNEWIWLGASDREGEDVWMWVDGSDMDRSLFEPGEPNNYGEEDCLGNKSKGRLSLIDLKCSLSLKFICEYKSNCFIVE